MPRPPQAQPRGYPSERMSDACDDRADLCRFYRSSVVVFSEFVIEGYRFRPIGMFDHAPRVAFKCVYCRNNSNAPQLRGDIDPDYVSDTDAFLAHAYAAASPLPQP